MRVFLAFFIGIFFAASAAAFAQDSMPSAYGYATPLYMSKSSNTGGRLYNGGGQPLSLRQITQGRSTSGYDYNPGTGFTPYGSGNSGSNNGVPSIADVQRYNAQKAAEARMQEQQTMNAFLSGDQNASEALTPLANVPQQGNILAAQNAGQFQGASGTRYVYRGRKPDIQIPKKVFNRVQ